ncbi:MAG: hypothetical protein E7343_02765 [Clostridiales bacterium]|nr:hypothetical protein [Clostridiales bacterium]
MKNEQAYQVGVYCRLSQEDGREESQSIIQQKEILVEYVQRRNWEVVEIYADDGYTGTNFNRPDFNRMLTDIEKGKINMVITKDLSRLGRNYIHAGYYVEEYFPQHNVRYIAVNDNYDSIDEDSGDFMPLKNIINEWYAKDISKKIRFTLDGKAKKGEPRNTVFPIFGYAYNERYERVPDPVTADVVRLIYQKYIEYGSTSRVAKFLRRQGVYVPRFFNAIKYGYNKTKVLTEPKEKRTAWTTGMVRDIIIKDAYLGRYKTAQTKGVSFKNKKRRKNQECYVFENRYEPLVDLKVWEQANALIHQNRSGSVFVEDNEYKGLLICQNCGKPLRFEQRKNAKNGSQGRRYYCNNKNCSKGNSIQKKYLDELLLRELELIKNTLLFGIDTRQYDIRERISSENKLVDIQRAVKKAKENAEKVDKKILFLIEKRAEGLLTDITFENLISKYKTEKETLEEEIQKLQNYAFVKRTSEYTVADIPTALRRLPVFAMARYDFLQKIIDKIEVGSDWIKGSARAREISLRIRYKLPMEFLTAVGDAER